MKIAILLTGKTSESYLREGMNIYEKRLQNYLSLNIKILPELKKTATLPIEAQKQAEGRIILDNLNPGDIVLLLDEKGKTYSSVEFSELLQKYMLQSVKNLIFVIGGPYGFSQEVYTRADGLISLSRLTFSHQMVRLILLEQLYRGMSILKNEPYHH